MKRYIYEEDHEMFREAIKGFLKKEISPHTEQWRKDGIASKESWLKMGENGFLAFNVPEEYGGLGISDFRYHQIVNEEMGRIGETSFFPALHTSIVVPFIIKFGTEEQKKKYLPGCVTGEYIMGICMSEPDIGSDFANIKTTAKDNGDHYLINGSKTYISNGLIGNLFIVAARTGGRGHSGISLFIVESDFKGFNRGKKLEKIGMPGQDTSELYFEDMVVPKENLLGELDNGFKCIMAGLVDERLVLATMVIGICEAALEQTIKFTKERKLFNQTVFGFQNTQFKLAEIRAKVDQMTAYVDHLVYMHYKGDCDHVDAAKAKLLSSELVCEVVDECLQLHGGSGYMTEYPIAQMYMDVRVHKIFAGTSEIMKLIIAREL